MQNMFALVALFGITIYGTTGVDPLAEGVATNAMPAAFVASADVVDIEAKSLLADANLQVEHANL